MAVLNKYWASLGRRRGVVRASQWFQQDGVFSIGWEFFSLSPTKEEVRCARIKESTSPGNQKKRLFGAENNFKDNERSKLLLPLYQVADQSKES